LAKKIKIFLRNYWRSLLCSAVICFLLFLPGNKFPKERFFYIKHFDKLVHLLLFASLEWFLLFDGHIKKLIESIRLVIFSTLLALIFGGLTELIQHYFIPDRTGSIYDLTADITGMLMGIILYRIFPGIINRLRYLQI
jgi:VanZ family protein